MNRPLPRTPASWLKEIKLAFADASEAEPFGRDITDDHWLLHRQHATKHALGCAQFQASRRLWLCSHAASETSTPRVNWSRARCPISVPVSNTACIPAGAGVASSGAWTRIRR